MCGIAAILAYDTSSPGVDEAELVAIRDSMASRGPDGAGSWFDSKRRVGLGHRRLSIIDVSSAGHQPMLLPERNLAIAFNGEIYNYRRLRTDLEAKGCHFRSQCDTEVLLHLYATEGEGMLEKLRGMYAFAIWDGASQTLFLARDPFGIKPLYCADDGKTFRIASQVKALLAGGCVDTSPEPAGHVGYFLWGHLPAPYTLYRGIRDLPAGHCLTVKVGGKKRLRAFSSIPGIIAEAETEGGKSDTRKLKAEMEDRSQILSSSLRDSVVHHLIADVPVGVFLSAGLDSTTLAALAAESGGQLRTITLGFEEFKGTANDETPLAEEVARHYGTRHQTIWVTRKDFENDLHHLLDAMDQPSSDGVNSYFISKAAAQAGLKVALSGLGGDELFGSYPSFREIPRAVSAFQSFQQFPLVGRATRVVTAPFLKRMTSPKYAGLLEYGGSYGGAYLLRRGMFMPWELPGILDPDLVREGWNELQTLRRLADTTNDIQSPHLKVSALEMTWYMRHQLLRDTDWASMAHSLEIRTPLVDSQLLCRIAPMLMRDPRPTKRDMAQTPRSQLPTSVLNRPKTGFTVPVRNWLLKAFDPSPGAERGLRGWTREVYSVFADTLENHHASLQRQRKVTLQTHRKIDAPTAARKLRLFVLLTDGFGGFGGIAKFNRDFLAALCSHNRVEQVTALPRIMPNAPEALPPKLTHVICGLGGKRRYVQAVIQNAKKFRADNHSGGQSVVICAHIHLLPAALLARRICGGGLHLIVHGVDAWKPTRNRLANACVRRISGFISVSNVTKRRFMRWSHLRDDQGVVLPNCVDLSAFCPGPKSEALLDRYQLRGKKVLLTLGRLASEERYKGFDEVLEVMPALVAQIPNVFYLICGDGQDRQRLECKAVELGIRNRVIFAGRISDGEKADHYRLADAYIMPGWGEGFGIVYLEALACGIPVIGSKADGSREALLNGQLGILVDPRDSKEIISAVLKILRPGAHDERRSADVRSSASEPISAFQSASISASANGHSVDYFSAARFEQRVHDIVDCISS